MACEIIGTDGAVLSIRISGIMKLSDQQSLQAAGMELMAKGGKLRLLIALVDFQGWEKGVDWGDVGFLMSHGDDITKMAIVGDEKWKDQVFAFVGKGFRKTEIEFFPSSSMKQAESWLRT